jgi:hypothetical protein
MSPIDKYYITLSDGVQREIKFTLAVLRRLKAKTGKSLMTGEGLAGIDEDFLPAIIHEALCDKSITEDQVADNIALPDIGRIVEEMMKAFSGSVPEKKDSEKN